MATEVGVLVGDGSLGFGSKYCSRQSIIHPSQRGVGLPDAETHIQHNNLVSVSTIVHTYTCILYVPLTTYLNTYLTSSTHSVQERQPTCPQTSGEYVRLTFLMQSWPR